MQKQPISEQARLAISLADCLGREGAINVCRANGWDGVLGFLLDEMGDRYTERPTDG